MSEGTSTGRRNRGGTSAPPGQTPASRSSTSSADATMEEEVLRLVQKEIADRNKARGRAEGGQRCSSSATPSPSRLCRGAHEAAKTVLGITKNSSPSSSTRSAARLLHEEQALSDVAGTSRSAPEEPARTGSNDKTRSEQQQGEAVFTEMEQAMTSHMDLSYKKVEPPKLPCEFATKWPHGHSVDQSYHQLFSQQKKMIAAWCLDHSNLSSFTTSHTLSVSLIPPSEEQIQDILVKFSGNSGLQKEALHLIHRMSKTSKGMQPCLDTWPNLVPVLIDLKQKWKSVWTRDLDGERLAIILNLSLHRPNREILAGQNKLPGVLKQVVEKADMLGTSASLLAIVASIVAILSEFDLFRKRMLDIGGMKMLRDLLKIENVEVRKETGAAILAVCTDGEGKSSAVVYDVPDTLLECFMVTDEFLLLLDHLPKAPHVLEKICDQAVELVNIVMEEQASGMETSQGIHSAISLIYIIVQRDVHKMKRVKNLEKFKERLRELSSRGMPTDTHLKVEKIISTLTEMFPLRMMINWDDASLRKIRPLRAQERIHSGIFFKDLCLSWFQGKSIPNPLYKIALEELQTIDTLAEYEYEGGDRREVPVPPMLRCPLSGDIMLDPVTISSGKTFDRVSLELWFKNDSQICPVTGWLVSDIILPNERVKCYLEEWDDAVRAAKAWLRKRK